ncbi:Methyltransf-21 domain-containing protein [Aphelenchoides besseyi]|nr:Methyltransf-21 domain-containing protein [Aphelenchoides besseyi]
MWYTRLYDSKTDPAARSVQLLIRVPCALLILCLVAVSLAELIALLFGIERLQKQNGGITLIRAQELVIGQQMKMPKIERSIDVDDKSERCRNKSFALIEKMRNQQTLLTANWTFSYPRLWDRWHVMADYFGPAVNDLKHSFRPFTYIADDEFKHWLEMKDRTDSCNMITIGVGEVWDGEKLIRKKYPQCSLLGVDPGATINRRLVESMNNSRFVHAAVSDRASRTEIYGKDNGTYVYQQNKVVSFVDLLARENGAKLVDFMSIDAEGAEFSLLPILHHERHKLPIVCQFNMELHFKERNYDHSVSEFMEILRGFMAEAHFVLMDIDVYDHLPLNIMMRRVFFVNVMDSECVSKFLC